jgi:beta,beta-carotene 9',10'-dioxygenase
MADGGFSPDAGVLGFGASGPYRAPRAPHGERAATVRGELPGWLRGSLVRTCPARFRVGAWEAAHWFDGLGMLYAFELADGGARLRFRDLDSDAARALAAGRRDVASFATPMRRPWWRRLLQPVPTITDNANVNVVPRGDGLVALTESPRQLRVARDSLAVTGEHTFRDALGDVLHTAHPVYDRAKGVWVDVCTDLGARPSLCAVEHDRDGGPRRLLARWRAPALPYVHSFGVTDRAVLVFAHPLTVSPARLLFSDKGYADHLRWSPEPAQVLALDRRDGSVRAWRAPAGFVFHVIDAFEDDRGFVLDALVYDDAEVVQALRVPRMLAGPVAVAPRPRRYVLPRDGAEARVESLHDTGFEFPVVDRRETGERTWTWGARVTLDGARSTSTVIALDHRARILREHDEPGWVFGEPVFARRPGSDEEGDGALLAVGSHVRDDRALLRVFEPRTLKVLADIEVDVPLPLGFHGGFAPAARAG